MSAKIANIILAILFAETLGHGRRTEGMLAIAKCFGFFMFITCPSSTQNSKVLFEFYWTGWDRYLFLPFMFSGGLSLYGLVANIKSWRFSRSARFAGAVIGFFLWTFYALKSLAVGDLTTAGFILGIPAAIYGELGTMLYAAAGLPPVGARGNLGRIVE